MECLGGNEHTGMVKKLLDSSAMPARAFHQAMNAVIKPKIPAAFWTARLTPPSTVLKCAIARSKYVKSRKKKRLKKARVDFKVQTRSSVVKINQLQLRKVSLALVSNLRDQRIEVRIRNKVKPKCRHKCGFIVPVCSCDTESASFNHRITDPEATIRRKCSSTKSIYESRVSQRNYQFYNT